MSNNNSRRDFLKCSAAFGATALTGSLVSGCSNSQSKASSSDSNGIIDTFIESKLIVPKNVH